MDGSGAILIFTAVGFAAQLVDGALGMAYGLTATSVLLGLGIAPAVASASIHAAEVFTTAASGFAHWRLGNVAPRLVLRLALPGAIGGALGAWLLTDLPPGIVRPAVNLYLLVMAGVILWRAVRWTPPPPPVPPSRQRGEGPEAAAASAAAAAMPTGRTAALGLVGGFLDATGGGGWGPTVAATLLGGGGAPRQVIGSTNAAEFFVTLTVSATFFATIGLELWPVIAGLILGGVLAAPLAALLTRRLPPRLLMFVVAAAIALLALRGLARHVAALAA